MSEEKKSTQTFGVTAFSALDPGLGYTGETG
jgi:hypothetical protein